MSLKQLSLQNNKGGIRMKKILSLFFLSFFLIDSIFAVDFFWQKKGAQEFINVETHFSFSDTNGANKRSMVYGSTDFDVSDSFVPNFKIGIPVLLNVQMHPTLLKKAGNTWFGVKNSEKSNDREITVELTITKSKNIQVTQSGGMTNVIPQPNIDGSTTYTFTIRNNSEIYPSIAFKFVPAEQGEANITVTYYGSSPDQKIVDRSCDVFQNVSFSK